MNSLTKIIVISLVAFAAIVSLVLFLARPILAQIGTLHEDESKQQAQLDQLQAQLAAYNKAKSQLREVNYKDVIDRAVLERENLGEVLVEVEAFAAKTHVTETFSITDDLISNNNEKTKPQVPGEKNITEVPYTLNFTATFADTLDFMQYLEHLSHFTELSRLSFNAVNGRSIKEGELAVHTDEISGSISGVFFVKKK